MQVRKQWAVVRHMVRILCILGLLIVALLGKVLYHSWQDYRRGEDAYAQQRYQDAVMHYERAIKWYAPFNPMVQRAIDRLWSMASEAEQRGDRLLALEASRSLRASLYAIQSLYLPYQPWIPKTEAMIARLMAETMPAESSPGADHLARQTAQFTQMLRQHRTSSTAGMVLTEVGFLCWIGATMGFIWRAFAPPGQSFGRQGAAWGGAIVGFFLLWIVGMLLA